MIKPQTLKGFRDFLPAEARKRQYVINTLQQVFERYGFEPLETPTLEYDEILTGKYGEEGDQLMYRFEDNGKRKVAMRYDQTVPLARVVAQYLPAGRQGQNELTFPFKRYQIQPVWRAENTQKGRYREFIQCDVDIVGAASTLSDAEILTVVYDCYKALDLNVVIKYNDRALLRQISDKTLTVLDKLNKIGEQGVIKELIEKGSTAEEAESLLKQTRALKASVLLREIKEYYCQLGYPEDTLQFEETLIRGLNYYTGVIAEVVLKDSSTSLSLGGGGRYNKLIGMFTNREIPAVGFSFGFDRIIEAMEELKLFPANLAEATTQVLVSIFSEKLKPNALTVSSLLRSSGINVEIYLGEIKEKNPLEKQLKYAVQKNISYFLILGPEEAQNNIVTVKDLRTREQQTLPVEKLIDMIKR